MLVLGGIKWYSSRPKSWDAKSITCVSATAVPTYNYTPEARGFKIAGFSLTFALSNNTNHDYTVPENVKLLRTESGSKALADFDDKVGHAVLIPARERAELTIATEYSCSDFDAAGHETQRDEKTCFNDAFGDAIGFVALDEQQDTAGLDETRADQFEERERAGEPRRARFSSGEYVFPADKQPLRTLCRMPRG